MNPIYTYHGDEPEQESLAFQNQESRTEARAELQAEQAWLDTDEKVIAGVFDLHALTNWDHKAIKDAVKHLEQQYTKRS